MIAFSGSEIISSSDGFAWTIEATNADESFQTATRDRDGNYLLTAFDSAVWITSDFVTYDEITVPQTAFVVATAANGDVLVGGACGYLARQSVTEGAFTSLNQRIGRDYRKGVVFGAGRFALLDFFDGKIFSSERGTTWDEVFVTNDLLNSGLKYSPQGFLALERPDKSLTSLDGITWSRTTHNLPSQVQGASFLGWFEDEWILSASGGSLYRSPDGVAWTQSPISVNKIFRSIVLMDGIYVAAAGDASVYTSTDLVTWTSIPIAPNDTDRINTIASGNGRFIAFVRRRSPYISFDGITWEAISEVSSVDPDNDVAGFDPQLGFWYGGIGGGMNLLPSDVTSESRRQIQSVRSDCESTALAIGNGTVVLTGRDGLILTIPSTSTNYETWAATFFPANSPDALSYLDPDGDGMTNLEEYARGKNPTISDDTLLHTIFPNQSPVVTHQQTSDQCDVTTIVEHSLDLKIWSTNQNTLEEVPNGDGTSIIQSSLGGNLRTEPKIFLRTRWYLNNFE